MDPLGFGLEHFNAIGAWRAQDGKTPVDASGTLPNGQNFQGHHELKQILMNERDDFVEGLAEKLLIYALGRGLQRYDRPAVTTITSLPSERTIFEPVTTAFRRVILTIGVPPPEKYCRVMRFVASAA